MSQHGADAASDAYLFPVDFTDAIDHGHGVTTLHYPDGTIRIRHLCKTIPGDDGPLNVYVAPALQLDGGHRIVQAEPLTVEPSILCPDCQLHGWITEGWWHQ